MLHAIAKSGLPSARRADNELPERHMQRRRLAATRCYESASLFAACQPPTPELLSLTTKKAGARAVSVRCAAPAPERERRWFHLTVVNVVPKCPGERRTPGARRRVARPERVKT